jgi:hypothetical protein
LLELFAEETASKLAGYTKRCYRKSNFATASMSS